MEEVLPSASKFAPNLTPEEKYVHGYTDEEVARIKSQRDLIVSRDLFTNPVSLEEFKNVIIPFYRIQRTEVFKLQETKVKVPKEPKPPKEKKLTKKAIQARITQLIFLKAAGGQWTEEDKKFMTIHQPTFKI